MVGWWTFPYASGNPSFQPAYSSTWVRLGGNRSGMPLIHGGTESNDITSTNYNLCYQILNTSFNIQYESSVGGLHAVPDNNMYVDIWFTVDSSTGKGTAHFYYHDLKNGNATSINVSGTTSYSVYNSTSEWIVEQPTVNNSTTENTVDYASVLSQEKIEHHVELHIQ